MPGNLRDDGGTCGCANPEGPNPDGIFDPSRQPTKVAKVGSMAKVAKVAKVAKAKVAKAAKGPKAEVAKVAKVAKAKAAKVAKVAKTKVAKAAKVAKTMCNFWTCGTVARPTQYAEFEGGRNAMKCETCFRK